MAENKANTAKTTLAPSSKQTSDPGIESAKPELRDDRILKLMMKVGIPLALLSVLSLWASSYFGSAGIGLLFFISAPLALVIGFSYNIRYVMLLVRQRRNQQPPKNKP